MLVVGAGGRYCVLFEKNYTQSGTGKTGTMLVSMDVEITIQADATQTPPYTFQVQHSEPAMVVDLSNDHGSTGFWTAVQPNDGDQVYVIVTDYTGEDRSVF